MKTIKILCLIVCMGFQIHASAQIFNPPYDFVKQTSAYQHLGSTATILVPLNSTWDDTTLLFTTPFPFTFMKQTTTNFVMNAYGVFSLESNYDFVNDIWGTTCANLLLDYVALPNSIIKKQTVGNNGSRIFKMEFQNVGLYDDVTGNDSLNFQLWLYEQDNSFEWHFGNSYIANSNSDFGIGAKGPSVLNFKESNIDSAVNLFILDSVSSLTGAANSPTYVPFTKDYSLLNLSTFEFETITGWPANGTVYRFSPKSFASISQIQKSKYQTKVYPNPTTDHIQFDLENIITNPRIVIINRLGQIVYEGLTNSTSHFDIPISQLPSATFQVLVYSDGELMISESFLKK